MQYQHHVNKIGEGGWPQCRKVTLVDGRLDCQLALDRTYNLVDAYDCDPHLRLLACESDQQLVSFVRVWGPLWLSFQERETGTALHPIVKYRAVQRWLIAFVGLLSAVKRSSGERESLKVFYEAEVERDRNSEVYPVNSEPVKFTVLRHSFGVKSDFPSWMDNCDLQTVRAAADFTVSVIAFVAGGAGLRCVRKGKQVRIDAHWRLTNLLEALEWMVWYDEFTQHPIVCCQECRKIFRAETAHVRKYCSYECGHRVAARKWQKAKREG